MVSKYLYQHLCIQNVKFTIHDIIFEINYRALDSFAFLSHTLPGSLSVRVTVGNPGSALNTPLLN